MRWWPLSLSLSLAAVMVAPAASAEDEPPAESSSAPDANVHLATERPLVLYRRPGGSTAWVLACTSPCDADLPRNDEYRLTGDGIPSSSPFYLDIRRGRSVDLRAAPPSTAGMITGGALAAGGGAALLYGLMLATFDPDAGGNTNRSHGPSLSLPIMAIGCALLATGIVVFRASATTDVVPSSRSSSSESAPTFPPSFLRSF